MIGKTGKKVPHFTQVIRKVKLNMALSIMSFSAKNLSQGKDEYCVFESTENGGNRKQWRNE